MCNNGAKRELTTPNEEEVSEEMTKIRGLEQGRYRDSVQHETAGGFERSVDPLLDAFEWPLFTHGDGANPVSFGQARPITNCLRFS